MDQTEQCGLTSAEVEELNRKGFVNQTKRSDWADYRAIASRHLFTLFNFIVAPAAITLFSLGEWRAALAVSGMVTVNTVVGLFQEIRAKRHLDRLAILTQSKASVIRDGQRLEIPSSEVVLGDCLLLQTGDAVVADGAIIEAHFLEVDEALLTGESDPAHREPGQRLLSGSVCVAGDCVYRVDKVGKEAFAQTISAAARRYHHASSPMTHVVNLLITILSCTAVALCAFYLVLYFLGYVGIAQLMEMIASTITSMVPQGLVLIMTVSFTVGAVVMSRRGALVQRLNAVEAMASVDVICTDKTGTLTTNRLRLSQLQNVSGGLTDAEVRRRLALLAEASVDRRNRNIQALRSALGPAKSEAIDQIPFMSKNRFSAVRLRDENVERVLVMGAPEVLLHAGDPNFAGIEKLQLEGLRVLIVAETPAEQVPSISIAEGRLPQPLQLVAIVALADELRPDAGAVMKALSAQNIAFKVISGDNPETVRATLRHLDLPLAREPVVSGKDLAESKDRSQLIEEHSVFGRVDPLQKVEIVESLQGLGHHVAMIGDGVNDVLPIKKADFGIAMGEGTQAAKTVSSLVLENNDFALLPETIEEGRTIVRNLRRASKLFLLKNVYALILMLVYAIGIFDLPFPFVPQQVTLLDWLVIGVPAFLIALNRERSGSASRVTFLRDVGFFALGAGAIIGLAGVVALALSNDLKTQRTMLLTVLILLGISAVFCVLDGGGGAQALNNDRRLRRAALGGIPFYLAMMYWPFAAGFFELTRLDLRQWLQVLLVAAPAYALIVGVLKLSPRLTNLRILHKPEEKT
jgi:cation-transporting P-type ATPase E